MVSHTKSCPTETNPEESSVPLLFRRKGKDKYRLQMCDLIRKVFEAIWYTDKTDLAKTCLLKIQN